MILEVSRRELIYAPCSTKTFFDDYLFHSGVTMCNVDYTEESFVRHVHDDMLW